MKEHESCLSFRYLFYDVVKITAGIPGLIWHRPRIYYENRAARAKIRNGALLVSNHLGFFDPIYLQYAVWYRRHHFVCLQKFLDSRIGWMFRWFLCIPIDKEHFSINSFHVIVDHLKRGELVSMFPEGKVNDGTGEIAPFKAGVVLMAYQSRQPVVPVYIRPKQHWYERIRIIMGEPVRFDGGMASFGSMDRAAESLEEKTRQLKELLEEQLCRPKTKRS